MRDGSSYQTLCHGEHLTCGCGRRQLRTSHASRTGTFSRYRYGVATFNTDNCRCANGQRWTRLPPQHDSSWSATWSDVWATPTFITRLGHEKMSLNTFCGNKKFSCSQHDRMKQLPILLCISVVIPSCKTNFGTSLVAPAGCSASCGVDSKGCLVCQHQTVCVANLFGLCGCVRLHCRTRTCFFLSETSRLFALPQCRDSPVYAATASGVSCFEGIASATVSSAMRRIHQLLQVQRRIRQRTVFDVKTRVPLSMVQRNRKRSPRRQGCTDPSTQTGR